MASPLVIPRAKFDHDGVPLDSGKLYSYGAGTSTPKATFTTAAGDVPNANPVILDGSGEADIWLSGAYKLTLTDSLDNELWTIDNVKEFLVAPAGSFTLVSSAPTVVDATTFTIPGDVTGYFFLNQRVKFTTSTTTVYARVNSAVYAAGITTVVISNGPINVGVPSGAYAGLGHPGLPIDARHVAFGLTSTVDAALVDRLSLVDGGTVEGDVVFNGNVTINDNVVFTKPLSVNVIASGILPLTAVALDIPISATVLAAYRKLKLSIIGCEAAVFYTPYLRLNTDLGPRYEYHTLVVGDVGVGQYHIAGNDSINIASPAIAIAANVPNPNPATFDIELSDLNNVNGIISVKYESGFVLSTAAYLHTRGVARYVELGPLFNMQILLVSAFGYVVGAGAPIAAAAGTWVLTGEV